MRQIAIVVVLIALVAVSSQAWYRAMTGRQAGVPTAQLQSVLLPEPRALTDFALADNRNEPFGKEQLQGQWNMLFFGYTHCPDICPTTMLTLKQTGREMVTNGVASPRMVLVSVDPTRDDPETLGRYVNYFGDSFVGVSGSDQELQALTRQVGAMYELDAPDAEGNYQVAHSGSIFVVNPSGRLHAVFSAPHNFEHIAAKMIDITKRYGAH